MVFGRRRDPLAGIDETTPHRFTIGITEPGHIDLAVHALATLSTELTLRVADDGVTVASTRSPRTAAVLRPLNALRRAAVNVTGFSFLDVIELTDQRRLEKVVAAWQHNANRGPARRRAESLGGASTLNELHQMVVARDHTTAGAARFVFGCATFNTPGSEYGVLKLASGAPDHAAEMVGWALDRYRVAALTGTRATFDVQDLLAILRRGGYAAQRALGLVAALPEPLELDVRNVLMRLAEADDDVAAGAAGLLGRAEPDAALRELLDRLMVDSSSNVRAAALTAASNLWGSDLRPVWHEWLNDRSAPLRETAEEMLGAHGDADDLDVAAAHLAKLIRRRAGQVSWSIPREAPVLELLMRYRGQPAAAAAFDDLYTRWSRLNPDLHDWFRREHPDLMPADGALPIVPNNQDGVNGGHRRDVDDLIVDDVMWPLPMIEFTDGMVVVHFDDTDLFETRDRFEELCVAHAAIKIIEADREVFHLDVDDTNPTGLLVELWVNAGGSPVR